MKPQWRLFFISFCVLFLELILIRYIPAHIAHIGFFSNLILLSCFLGMGLGILLSQNPSLKLLKTLAPILLLTIFIVNKYELAASFKIKDVIYYQTIFKDILWVKPEFILPLVFTFVALLMVPPSYEMGILLRCDKPLIVYFYNILGSLTGILCFNVCAYLHSPPVVWLAILMFIVLVLHSRDWTLISTVICTGAMLLLAHNYNSSTWSKYYRIGVKEYKQRKIVEIKVNTTNHQFLLPKSSITQENQLYNALYHLLPANKFKKALIIGAGGGNDVALAVHNKLEVDAVEIDETILNLGKKLHPEKPYSSKKVRTFVADGRAFINHSNKKYDIIIFALTDSLVLHSPFSNLRLESYLYTLETFAKAKKLLKKDGVLVLYNYYRQWWLIEKLAAMVQQTFDKKPAVVRLPSFGTGAIIIGGSSLHKYPKLTTWHPKKSLTVDKKSMATDNWPFLYMKSPSLPIEYLKFIAIFLVISLLSIFVVSKKVLKKPKWFSWHFFFLGMAFMLLETKSIITFSLLFGSTWMVNSFVFLVILSLVLLAVLVQLKFSIKQYKYWYLALFIVIVLNYIVPISAFAFKNFYARLVLAGIFYLFPVFLANVIFAQSFENTATADLSFSANLLGAMAGGFAEYTAMMWGYNSLMIVVFLFYVLAYTSLKK